VRGDEDRIYGSSQAESWGRKDMKMHGFVVLAGNYCQKSYTGRLVCRWAIGRHSHFQSINFSRRKFIWEKVSTSTRDKYALIRHPDSKDSSEIHIGESEYAEEGKTCIDSPPK
jgi:hypothetical protein